MDCPHCRGEISLSSEHWGRTWTCPHCRRPFHAAQPASLTQITNAPVHPATVTAGGVRQTVAKCRGCGQKYFRVSDPNADRCPSCGLSAIAPSAVGMVPASGGGTMTAYAGPQAGSYPACRTPQFEIAQMHSRLSTIQGCVMASGIVNVVMGSLLTLTCYLSPIGLPMLILGIFELVHHSKRNTLPPYYFASSSITLGIFEIVVGLFNVVSLIMGILVLGHATSVKSVCEKYRIYA
jgi:hypothetical protein